ncbi:MAG TPA: hypothetical protein VIT44_07175 [Cyclobacteriaceae bacterium]
MFKKIIWALLEIITIGSGTYIFVSTMTDEYGVDNHEVGLGAFLIVLGLLLRNWRMTLFIKEPKKDTDNKSINTVLILILSISIFVLNKRISDITSNVDDNKSEIQNLNSQANKFDDIETRLENLESFEDRIEDLENYSHSHY